MPKSSSVRFIDFFSEPRTGLAVWFRKMLNLGPDHPFRFNGVRFKFSSGK